ncbi:MAG TPA: YgiQ family radical SAM protein [Anaerovoracaceae bacterium]|nr:YgiQ family radical SAM protein [Anaerovoracaceae bacterium]
MFLPVNKKDMDARGWSQVDFVLVTGDGYVDHHSFGTAIISRLLESRGYKVAILPQPDYRSAEDFKRFGKPRLGFLINSGTVDSMVNNFSVFKHRRRVDEYSPGGERGKRPDRAVIVYSNRAREAYKDVPIIIGGIEASLRRLGHYDYWEDKVRRSILLDAKADLLIYGMGEKAIIEIAEALDSGIEAKDISWIRGTCYKAKIAPAFPDYIVLPAFEEIKESKEAYCRSFATAYRSNDYINGKTLGERYGDNLWVVQNPPQPPLEREDLDDVYELPYENEYHPMYEEMGGIPAFREIKFSIVSGRGCFGGCSFCALTYHQGRQVRSRSKESIVREATHLTEKPDFKGYIHDVGGPTANFRAPACDKQLRSGVCTDKDCLYPAPCKNMNVDHSDYLDVLRALRGLDKVKKVFIRSGIRYDYVMADPDDTFLRELCKYHVSGTLKVAPEHISDRVLYYMRKPSKEVFTAFSDKFFAINEKLGLKQYLIPYLISSHPGSTLDDAVELAVFLKKRGFVPDQVQDFYPTPGTLATCMYYTEMDPFTMEPVYVPKTMDEKKMQRALIHFNKAENRDTVKRALQLCGREDLIGFLLGARGGAGSGNGRKNQSGGRKNEFNNRASKDYKAKSKKIR